MITSEYISSETYTPLSTNPDNEQNDNTKLLTHNQLVHKPGEKIEMVKSKSLSEIKQPTPTNKNHSYGVDIYKSTFRGKKGSGSWLDPNQLSAYDDTFYHKNLESLRPDFQHLTSVKYNIIFF